MGYRYIGWVMLAMTENGTFPSYREKYTVKFNDDECWSYLEKWLRPFGVTLDASPFHLKSEKLVSLLDQVNLAIKHILCEEAVSTLPVEKIGTYKRESDYPYAFVYTVTPSVDRNQLLAIVRKLAFVISTALQQGEDVIVSGDYDNR